MKCYEHNDNYDLEHTPTNDQKVNCSKEEDVCVKSYMPEADSDPPIIHTMRSCQNLEGLKKELSLDSWQGSECTEKERKNGEKFTMCGCNTEYCNTSSFSAPFKILPLC